MILTAFKSSNLLLLKILSTCHTIIYAQNVAKVKRTSKMTSKMAVKIKITFSHIFQLFFFIFFTIFEGCGYLLSESHPGHLQLEGSQEFKMRSKKAVNIQNYDQQRCVCLTKISFCLGFSRVKRACSCPDFSQFA